MAVHPTAIVESGAELGAEVDVGPYALIGAGVRVGDRCRIESHASLRGPLELGEGCVVGLSAALGHDPQTVGNDGPFGGVRIGKRTVFREHTTVHRSMKPDGATVVGDDCYFMVGSHAAHDCNVGNHVVMTNHSSLAGHVEVGDRVVMGGGAAIHQFARIGELAMVGGHAGVSVDVPPFCIVVGNRPARLHGLNTIGLRRAGVGREARTALKEAYRTLFRGDLPLSERIAAVEPTTPEVRRLLDFLESSRRGVVGFGRTGTA